TGLIAKQLGDVAAGGLNSATGRNPIPRATTLWVTWEGGLITHFGFFPVLLAIPGAILLGAAYSSQKTCSDRGGLAPPWPALPVLLWTTLAVSVGQAILPLITLSSITTRWLMFSAWAIAVAGALGVAQLWRRGRGAQVITVAMALYVSWLTIAMFVEALA